MPEVELETNITFTVDVQCNHCKEQLSSTIIVNHDDQKILVSVDINHECID